MQLYLGDLKNTRVHVTSRDPLSFTVNGCSGLQAYREQLFDQQFAAFAGLPGTVVRPAVCRLGILRLFGAGPGSPCRRNPHPAGDVAGHPQHHPPGQGATPPPSPSLCR